MVKTRNRFCLCDTTAVDGPKTTSWISSGTSYRSSREKPVISWMTLMFFLDVDVEAIAKWCDCKGPPIMPVGLTPIVWTLTWCDF